MMQQQQAQQAQLMQQMQQQAAAFEKYKHDSELQFKYYKEQLDAALEEAKTVGDAVKDFELAKMTKGAAEDARRLSED